DGIDAEGASEVMRERLRRERARREAEVEELAGRVEQALRDLPFLERNVAQAAAMAAEGIEDDEELARSLPERLGARGPESAAERLELAERLRGNEKLRKLAA